MDISERKLMGQRIREARELQGLTQVQLADFLGIKNRASISSYEAGRSVPPGDVLRKLADILHENVDYLLGRGEKNTQLRLITPIDFGNFIRLERQSQGITQQQLGDMVGKNQRYISGYESGTMIFNDEEIEKIISALGYSLKDFKEKYNVWNVVPFQDVSNASKESHAMTEISAPTWANSKDKRDLKRIIEEDAPLMFDGVPIEGDNKQRVIDVLTGLFWEAKAMNKKTYGRKKKKNESDNE